MTRLEARVDEVIGLFERAQLPDGYVNSHILTWRPQHRFKNLRDLHELYCAGHLIEAAVVHFEATGKERLLQVARRFADHIATRFGREPGSFAATADIPKLSWRSCVFITPPGSAATWNCAATSLMNAENRQTILNRRL